MSWPPEGDNHDEEPEPIDPDSIDTGEPIALLRDLEESPSVGFLGRLRRAIERRRLASDVGGLAWHGPVLVVLELMAAVFRILGIGRGEQPD